jgi:hypothetical protein
MLSLGSPSLSYEASLEAAGEAAPEALEADDEAELELELELEVVLDEPATDMGADASYDDEVAEADDGTAWPASDMGKFSHIVLCTTASASASG